MAEADGLQAPAWQTPTQNPFSKLVPRRTNPEPARRSSERSTPTGTRNDRNDAVRTSALPTEHDLLADTFRITLDEDLKRNIHGHKMHYLPGLKADLEEQGEPVQLNTANLEQAILEAATEVAQDTGKPFQYLLSCWKRVVIISKGLSHKKIPADQPVWNVASEAKRLCMSWCMLAATMPDVFGLEPPETSPLVEHILTDSDSDKGLGQDFLREAAAMLAKEANIKEALVGAMEQISTALAKMSMNENFKPYVNVSRIEGQPKMLALSPLAKQALTYCRLYGPSCGYHHW
jgi:ubiquitin conjugation factor E4 B